MAARVLRSAEMDPLPMHPKNDEAEINAVLPCEIIVHIFGFVEDKELLFNVGLTCKWWRQLSHEETLWKRLLMSKYSEEEAKKIMKKMEEMKGTGATKDKERATGAGSWRRFYVSKLKTKDNWRKAHFQRQILPKEHAAAVFCVAFDGDTIVSGSSDHSIRLWDANSKSCVRKFDGHAYAVWSVKWLPESQTIISASYDSTIKIWNVESKKALCTLSGHASAIWALDYRAGKLGSGSTDTFLRIWDAETGRCTHKIAGQQDTIWCCNFIDDNTIATGGADARVWDIRSPHESDCQAIDQPSSASMVAPWVLSKHKAAPKDCAALVSRYGGHADAIRCVQADDNLLVTGSYDSTSFVFDMRTGNKLYDLRGHNDSITTLQYNKEGVMVSSSFDHVFVEWDLKTGAKVASWGQAPSSAKRKAKSSRLLNDRNAKRKRKHEPLRRSDGDVPSASSAASQSSDSSSDDDEEDYDCGSSSGAGSSGSEGEEEFASAEGEDDFSVHGGKVYALRFDEARLVSAREDGRLCLYDFSAAL